MDSTIIKEQLLVKVSLCQSSQNVIPYVLIVWIHRMLLVDGANNLLHCLSSELLNNALNVMTAALLAMDFLNAIA